MKKFIIAGMLVATLAATAQTTEHRSNLNLNVGGGLNTLLYTPANANHHPGMGGLFEFQLQRMFGPFWGFGMGLQASYLRASSVYDEVIPLGLVHADNNLPYTLNTQFSDWKEVQNVFTLDVPIQVYLRTPIDEKWSFQGAAGVNIQIPFAANYNTVNGTYQTSGYFPSTNVEYYDLENHGFCTTEAGVNGKIENMNVVVGALLDLGVVRDLNETTGLYMGVYADYGLNKAIQSVDNPIYDATTYVGTLSSNQVTKVHTLMLGIKMGLRIGQREDEEATKTYRTKAAQRSKKMHPKKAAEAAALEAAAQEKAAQEKAEQERTAKEKAAKEKAEQDHIAKEKAAKEKAEQDRIAKEKAIREKAEQGRIADENAAQQALSKEKAEQDRIAREKAEQDRIAKEKAEQDRIAKEKAEQDRIAKEKADQNNVSSKQPVRQSATNLQALLAGQGCNVIAYFENASSNPNVDSETEVMLKALALLMKEDASLKLTVIGYADNVGEESYNMELSQRRADAVKDLLVSNGIEASRIISVGKGEENPVATNDTAEGRALNRRVELTIEKK